MSSDTASTPDRGEFFFAGLPPLSLYVHLPWCEKKCPYCDFNSHALRGATPEEDYVGAIIADLEQELPIIWGRNLRSIFIGGGTPSLFDPSSIELLLSAIRARVAGIPDMEITIEANPGSSDASRFRGFRDAGVNRLSIGVQSFEDETLRRIGRVHDAVAARRAIESATSAGFDNFNIDVMHSLPDQTLDAALKDVETAVSFDPPHLSYYQLTIEPNTAFHVSRPRLPDHELSWQIQSTAEDLLSDAGYGRYEVSAYAREGAICQHNLNYWQYGDYLGIGAGAHSKITMADHVTRTWKIKHPAEYMKKASSPARIGGSTSPSPAEVGFEFMINALRLRRPVSSLLFQQHTGQSMSCLRPILLAAQDDGLVEFDGKTVTTTDLGYRFLDDLLQRFLPDATPARKASLSEA